MNNYPAVQFAALNVYQFYEVSARTKSPHIQNEITNL